MKENISLEHADDLNSGIFRIKANTFKTVASHWKLSLWLTEKNTDLKYECSIELKVNELNRVNIPLIVHSDVNQIGQINPNENHSFSCDMDNSVQDGVSKYLKEKGISYAADFYDQGNGRRPTKA